jgi:putative methyltransferase (TIGR04325 family)
MAKSSAVRRMRLLQIRVAAGVLSTIGRFGIGVSVLAVLRRVSPARKFLNLLLGYRQKFPTFQAAETYALRYSPEGHAHPAEIEFHSSQAGVLRESDYPMLYFMSRSAASYRKVFDLGGNVGNLFYSYAPWLELSPELHWTVFDLPQKQQPCLALAAKHAETRVKFTTRMEDASGADLLIASGSMHYFSQPLDRILSVLAEPPNQVLVNRSPFSRNEDVISVQDNWSYLVPCTAYGRPGLIDRMKRLGYELRAEWPVHERRLRVPLYSDVVEPCYAGMFFERGAR